MCNLKKYLIASVCFTSVILLSGCGPTDVYYYGGGPCCAAAPYYSNDAIIGSYYQSQSIGYWPYYSRPYIQREYYYTWY